MNGKSIKKSKVVSNHITLPQSYWKALSRIKEKTGVPISRQIRMAMKAVCES